MPEDTRSIPTAANPDLVTMTIQVEGQAIPDNVEVLSVLVSKEVNRIPLARIVLRDGDPVIEDFPVTNADLFIPGKAVEVYAGYHGEEALIFKGVVVQQSLRIRAGTARLLVDCRDVAFRMTIVPKCRYFSEVTDSGAMEEILGDYGVTPEVEATDAEHPELVQYEKTDWDFITNRADLNGRVCVVDDGVFAVRAPDLSQDAVLHLQYGATIMEFDAEMNGRSQYPGSLLISWDPANQTRVEVEGQDAGLEEAGNLTGADLAEALSIEPYEMRHGGHVSQEVLQSWADARLQKSRLAKIRGRVKFQGTADPKPGTVVTLGGVGDRFNGKVFVSGVRHELAAGNWITDVQFGLEEEWFARQRNPTAVTGALPGPMVSGLQAGVVTQLEEDPEGEDRIKVRLPVISAEEEGVWARLACLDAGENRGCFFRPEVDDEVVVGFIQGDLNEPVVLGMLHSSAKPAPQPITADNHEKGFITRSELKILFHDDEKYVRIETPGGKIFTLDDNQALIGLEDENGNKVTINADGISLESAKDIILKASGDLTVEAVNINQKASAQFKAEGGAGLEVSSGATTVVKGALVQIN